MNWWPYPLSNASSDELDEQAEISKTIGELFNWKDNLPQAKISATKIINNPSKYERYIQSANKVLKMGGSKKSRSTRRRHRKLKRRTRKH
jgi:hypothetical protein